MPADPVTTTTSKDGRTLTVKVVPSWYELTPGERIELRLRAHNDLDAFFNRVDAH